MKRKGMIGTAVLSLTLGVAAPIYAQQEQREQQQEKKAQPENSAKPAEKRAEKPSKNANQEEKTSRQRAQQSQAGKHEQHASGNTGGRIPEDRYRANFGQQHRFRVSQSDYGRDRRFQYGGYWFGFVDAWPGNWLYTQDVYVIEINGVYYLCNPMYPGVNILLSVTL